MCYENAKFRRTYWHEKLAASLVNFTIVLTGTACICLPCGYDGIQSKIVFLAVSLAYLLAALLPADHRSVGMKLAGVHWAESYSRSRLLVYGLFYLLSFSTVLFYLWWPFDLLVINLLLVQMPCIFLTGTTLHGFLSGGIRTVKRLPIH